MKKYDSTKDTLDHIEKVENMIRIITQELFLRSKDHDASKLCSPEKECFDIITPLLKTTTYGSQKYKDTLKKMRPAIDHHQKNNRHHPEFFPNGIEGMNLVDLVEMICDWKSASERHSDGDIYKSLKMNQERFNISDQLLSILKNTIDFLKEK